MESPNPPTSNQGSDEGSDAVLDLPRPSFEEPEDSDDFESVGFLNNDDGRFIEYRREISRKVTLDDNQHRHDIQLAYSKKCLDEALAQARKEFVAKIRKAAEDQGMKS